VPTGFGSVSLSLGAEEKLAVPIVAEYSPIIICTSIVMAGLRLSVLFRNGQRDVVGGVILSQWLAATF